MTPVTYSQAFQQAMHEEMTRDDRIFVLGTDLFDRGGHFGQVLGLGKDFGRERVRDMPISEAAMVAAGVGAALNGMRPVVDLNFIDFSFGAMDEIINQAAKMRYMFGTPMPLVIRGTSGVALYAAQHNNSLESVFAHIPGLLVAIPSTPADAKGLLVTAIEDANPVLFFEHKHLYRRIKGDVPDERYTIPFGEARVHRAGDEVTVVTWGAMVYTAEAAAARLAEDDVSVEVLDLRTLIPWDRERVLDSVRRCSKVLVLHEDTRTGGFGAEIAATIAEESFEHLDAPVRRLAAPDAPVPFSPVLEKAYIPQVDDVVTALRELAAY